MISQTPVTSAPRVTRPGPARASKRARLDKADSLSVLAASFAHELNQPLCGIISNASACLRMLSADPPNLDDARDTARRTIRDVNRAAEVVNRLRALFAKGPTPTESMDLNEAALEALALSRGELDAKRVTVKCMLADALPLVTVDRTQLQQVFLNLIRNAAEAMMGLQDHARELTITTRARDDGHVQLEVRDVGVGFRHEDADKLFTPFYTTKTNGMGIGLFLSRSIVEHHGGRLSGSPNPDGPGAAFLVSIPSASGR